jgi:hypothetical protein
MSTSARRRLYSTHIGGRLIMGALIGELLGGVCGLLLAPRRHLERTGVSTKPAVRNASEPYDDDDFDPKVAWPVLGSVAGLFIGLGAVRGTETFRRGSSMDGGSRRVEETPR